MNNYEKIRKIKDIKKLADFLENDDTFFDSFFNFKVEKWLESEAIDD